MTFNHLNRRIHLYLGMFSLPWFAMYALSSLPFNHAAYFDKLYGPPQRIVHFDRPYSIDIPPGADLKGIARRILADNGLHGDFGIYRPNSSDLSIYMPNFIQPVEIRYTANDKRVVASSPRYRFMQMLIRMHAYGGFELDSFWSKCWAVIIDVVCVGLLLWIASGIYMWWKLTQTRLWGWIAILAGLAATFFFLHHL